MIENYPIIIIGLLDGNIIFYDFIKGKKLEINFKMNNNVTALYYYGNTKVLFAGNLFGKMNIYYLESIFHEF